MMTQPSSMMMLGFNVAVPLGSRAVTSISSTSTTGFRVKVRVGSNNRLSSVTTTTTRSSMYGWVRDMMSGNKGKTDSDVHAVLGKPLRPPNGKNWEAPLEEATFGLGCFWGAERKFWKAKGVYTTSVGYSGGDTKDPTYRAVCSGTTGHAEVVNVVFDSSKTSYEKMLDIFWEAHDPTTKNRQGNDVGTQYRSIILTHSDAQMEAAKRTRDHFNGLLKKAGRNDCTTEIASAEPLPYYLAEDYHQQYLHKNPWGYCGLGGTGLYKACEPPKQSAM